LLLLLDKHEVISVIIIVLKTFFEAVWKCLKFRKRDSRRVNLSDFCYA
jgi:hypothetical protein